MAQRVEPNDSLDFFPTPPWATRALCEHVLKGELAGKTVWEPACGSGTMAEPLKEYAERVYRSDVFDYSNLYHGQQWVQDFLFPSMGGPWVGKFTGVDPEVRVSELASVDWIITNPPFRLGEEFAYRALDIATDGVALLVRTVFLESIGRYEGLFSKRPPNLIAQFVERCPMVKGRLDRKASTATSYCWLVWRQARPIRTVFTWIPPCRKQLERDSDYQLDAKPE